MFLFFLCYNQATEDSIKRALICAYQNKQQCSAQREDTAAILLINDQSSVSSVLMTAQFFRMQRS